MTKHPMQELCDIMAQDKSLRPARIIIRFGVVTTKSFADLAEVLNNLYLTERSPGERVVNIDVQHAEMLANGAVKALYKMHLQCKPTGA